ncbi:MAG: hypothetical protein ABIF09_01005 [Gemmatimonadota bacterium]
MTHSAALPFTLRRSNDVISGGGITTTTETVHGLLRLVDDRLLVQWRLARKTDHIGGEIRSDEEVEAVRQVAIPLEGVAGAVVRHRWWEWPGGSRLELTASDLQAFEEIAGQAGLRMTHPAQLVLKVQRRDRLAAEEFAADLALALARQSLSDRARYRSLRGLEEGVRRLPEGDQQPE